MIGLLCLFLAALASPLKSKLRLEAENAVLRHQLNVLRCSLHGRVRLTNHDRLFFIQLLTIARIASNLSQLTYPSWVLGFNVNHSFRLLRRIFALTPSAVYPAVTAVLP